MSLCFISGAVTTVIGLLHLGFLIDFISVPVICGFTNAAAIIIGASQITSLLGIGGRSDTFIDCIDKLIHNIHKTVLADSILGLSSVLLLVGLKVKRRFNYMYYLLTTCTTSLTIRNQLICW